MTEYKTDTFQTYFQSIKGRHQYNQVRRLTWDTIYENDKTLVNATRIEIMRSDFYK